MTNSQAQNNGESLQPNMTASPPTTQTAENLYLSELVDNLSDAFIATDINFKIVHWNKAAQLIYGWQKSEAIGQPIARLIQTEYVKDDQDSALQKVMSVGVWSGKVLQSGQNFKQKPVFSTVSLVKDEHGEVVGMVAINRDLTGQESAEERFRLAVESAPNAIIMVDQKGKIVLLNPQTEKYFGYEKQELIGKSVEQLVPVKYSNIHPQHRAAFLASPQIRDMGVGRDLYALRKDGSEFPVEIGLAPIETQEGTFVLATIVDITERKQADERFRLAVESAPNAIVMVSQNGQIILVNPQTEKYFGYEKNELIGQSVDRLVPERFTSIHPNHRADFLASPQIRDMGVGRDLYALRKDGSEFPVEIGLAPIETHEGTFVLATIVDITERKQAEEETRRLNRELEAFAHSVSHDLRAPLRGIDGFSGMLEQKYAGSLDEQALHYLARIRANVSRMGHMIDDLLFLAKMTGHVLKREKVNLSMVAQDILDELMAQEPGRRVQFEIEEQVVGWCDAGLVQLVLQNLLGNAWKFTATRAAAVIHFGRAPRNRFGNAVYFVRDNGVGFDMAYADKLFGAFQRLHTESEFPGTGIGLATVQRIIHRHGGHIWVEASLNEGATFFFTLGG